MGNEIVAMEPHNQIDGPPTRLDYAVPSQQDPSPSAGLVVLSIGFLSACFLMLAECAREVILSTSGPSTLCAIIGFGPLTVSASVLQFALVFRRAGSCVNVANLLHGAILIMAAAICIRSMSDICVRGLVQSSVEVVGATCAVTAFETSLIALNIQWARLLPKTL